MENQINNVCLSFQCPMQWATMQAISSRERFCSQCHLAVTDFTNATQQELTEKLKTSPGRVCGRFKRSQMSADYLTRIAAAVIVTSAMACTPDPTFQPPEIPTPVENVVVEEETLLGDVMFLPDSLEDISLTGIIVKVEADSVDVKK